MLILAVSSFSHAASAAKYKGKCAKQAEGAAITKWADVPNPDENLEYITVGSFAVSPRSDTYEVVLALNDGNETAYAEYVVKFENLGSCKLSSVAAR